MRRDGFTILELLISLSLLALLAGITFPAIVSRWPDTGSELATVGIEDAIEQARRAARESGRLIRVEVDHRGESARLILVLPTKDDSEPGPTQLRDDEDVRREVASVLSERVRLAHGGGDEDGIGAGGRVADDASGFGGVVREEGSPVFAVALPDGAVGLQGEWRIVTPRRSWRVHVEPWTGRAHLEAVEADAGDLLEDGVGIEAGLGAPPVGSGADGSVGP